VTGRYYEILAKVFKKGCSGSWQFAWLSSLRLQTSDHFKSFSPASDGPVGFCTFCEGSNVWDLWWRAHSSHHRHRSSLPARDISTQMNPNDYTTSVAFAASAWIELQKALTDLRKMSIIPRRQICCDRPWVRCDCCRRLLHLRKRDLTPKAQRSSSRGKRSCSVAKSP
jgi:hypothetical protein